MQADTLYNYMSSRNIFLFHKRIPNLHIPYMLYTVLHFKLSIKCFKYIILDPIYPLLYMQDMTPNIPLMSSKLLKSWLFHSASEKKKIKPNKHMQTL